MGGNQWATGRSFELLHEPTLSTVCFRHLAGDPADPDEQDRLLAIAAQHAGRVYIAPAVVDGTVGLRACFVNFHTRAEDADALRGIARERYESATCQRRRPKSVV